MYDLAIGDRSYSSWSLRGWLLFENFGLPVRSHLGVLYSDAARYRDARSALSSCVDADPSDEQCRKNLALVTRKLALVEAADAGAR